MKIAVATADGTALSQHFGRSAGFIVFEVEGTKIGGTEFRTNRQTPHAQGLCQGEHKHGHSQHNHTGIVDLLKDCEIVLCGGMGARAAEALREQGVRAVVMPFSGSAEEALSSYLSNGTTAENAGFCNCAH